MNSELRVRSLIYKASDNKYVKQIDDRGIGQFIELLTEEKKDKSPTVIYNFSPVISAIHTTITEALSNYENEDLKRKHNAMFNNWARLKSFTNEALLSKATLEVMNESEKVLTWVHTRLEKMEKNRRQHRHDCNEYWREDSKTNELREIMIEVDTFIESLLCNIHSTLLIDAESISQDTVLTMHVETMYDFLNDILRYESGVLESNEINDFSNIVEHSCMEELDINPEELLLFLG
ncbi:hypothetical protein, partial [Vibrio cholerae]|uniref:hypothetical protein n=1 Tax=Vibrio cholerae TaxID=666 RepID=UPI00115E43BB